MVFCNSFVILCVFVVVVVCLLLFEDVEVGVDVVEV